MQDVNLLHPFFADQVHLEAPVEVLVSWVPVVVPVLELKELIDRDNAALHGVHCTNRFFLRIWEKTRDGLSHVKLSLSKDELKVTPAWFNNTVFL